jgi:uncharacterized membrane protein
MALVIPVAVGARTFKLADRVVWFDEAVSLLVARAPSVRAAFVAARDEGHGPLFNIVLHYWTRILPGESGARWFSVLCGVATVGVVWAIGMRVANVVGGTVAALLLALCPLHVWYSQEIRMYALQGLLVALSYLLLLKALERQRPGTWLLYAVVTTLSLYAQYTSFLALAAQCGFVLLTKRRQTALLRHWAMAQGMIVLLFLPWATELAGHLREKAHGYWIRPFTWDAPVKFFSLLSGSYLTDERGRWMVVAITLALLTAALVIVWRKPVARERTLMLTLWLFVPLVLLASASLYQNLFLPRAILFVAPAFGLLIGCAATQLFRDRRRTIALIGVGTILVLNAHALHGYYVRDNVWVKSPLRAVCVSLTREIQPGDIVVHTSEFTYRPMQVYLEEATPQCVLGTPDKRPGLLGIIGDGHVPTETASCRRIWLIAYPDFLRPGLHHRAVEWMDAHHLRMKVLQDSPMLFVALYDRDPSAWIPPAAE